MRSRKKTRKNKKDRKSVGYKSRIFTIVTIFSVIFIWLVVVLFYNIIVRGRYLAAEASSEWKSEVSITAKRGDILDRNGNILVSSANVYRVDFDLTTTRNYIDQEGLTRDEVAGQIADITGKSKEEVLAILNLKNEDGTDATYSSFLRGITKDIADKLEDLDIYGMLVSREIERYYPNGHLLSSVLGCINSEGRGLTGIELQYDDYLTGISGMGMGGFDGDSHKLPFVPYKFTPAVDGKDVVLTVDENLQYIADQIAEEGLEKNKAKGVEVIIMDPNNGEILAMSNKPDYDPNKPYEGYESFEGETDNDKIQNMWRNRAISDTYEPGSTFKNITMIAAMEEGVVSENDTFVCDGGLHFGDAYIKCWNIAGHGVQTLSDILKNSCNVGFMELGKRLGIEKLNEYINKLGFGKLTGIDLPGEAEGIIKPNDQVSEIDLATIAFGQTDTVTAIQLMQAFNAIANGGDLIEPHIVKEISSIDKNGTRVVEETIKPTIKRDVLSEENTAILRGYLERTATQDGPVGSFVQGYSIGGKTGTAQKVDPETGRYSTDKYIASMVALAPVDNPEITVFISVDEPSTGVYYGGQVATPLMKELFSKIFEYMDSPLAQKRFSMSRNVIIPEVRGEHVEDAKATLSENNLEIEIKGNGKIVTSISPYPGAIVKEGTTITINTKDSGQIHKDIIMPDLKGTTADFAKSILDNLGIACILNGQGSVDSQSIASGSVIKKGTEVTITLKEESEY